MATEKPALVTQTKPNNEATRDEKVVVKRTVTYEFLSIAKGNLRIPYAVAVGGQVQDAFKTKPKRVSGNNGKIVVTNVTPGQQVTLYLNSDAHPKYRKNPVYAVTPEERDVIVYIEEVDGKRPDSDALVLVRDDLAIEALKQEDTYTAVLTGDIWMKVSHKYSSEEIDALLPSGTSALVASAVKKIYDGLTEASLNIVVPPVSAKDPEETIQITFDDGNDPHKNINSGYYTLKEGLKRVHPAGYAAIFTAAIDAGVNMLAISSCWRPLSGSITHRAGLGLDVNYVGTTRMNRQKLRKATAVDAGNVSPEEQNLLSAFESSKKQQVKARKAIKSVQAEVDKTKGPPDKLIAAKQKLQEATDASKAADEARRKAELAWNAERDKNEPERVRRFRASLINCERVAQLFDPWFMDENTRDKVAATPNLQEDENEKLHAHHLHITIAEPNIL